MRFWPGAEHNTWPFRTHRGGDFGGDADKDDRRTLVLEPEDSRLCPEEAGDLFTDGREDLDDGVGDVLEGPHSHGKPAVVGSKGRQRNPSQQPDAHSCRCEIE